MSLNYVVKNINEIAGRMFVISAIAGVGSMCAESYFDIKREHFSNNSSVLKKEWDIEGQSLRYLGELHSCDTSASEKYFGQDERSNPVIYSKKYVGVSSERLEESPSLEKCIEVGNEYKALQSQLVDLKKSLEYLSAWGEERSLSSSASFWRRFNISTFFPMFVGLVAYGVTRKRKN